MDWATIFVGFLILFSLFSFDPSTPVVKSESLTNISISSQLPDEIIPDFAPNISSINISELNQYQIIVSYIMDNFKSVHITDVLTIAENIISSAIKYNLDPYLITSLISVESCFNKNAVSKSDAKGLGQIKDFHFKGLGITNPFDIQQNVKGTTQHLKELLVRWKGNVKYALASYLEGPYGIKNQEGKEWKKSTTAYVETILIRYKKLQTYE